MGGKKKGWKPAERCSASFSAPLAQRGLPSRQRWGGTGVPRPGGGGEGHLLFPDGEEIISQYAVFNLWKNDPGLFIYLFIMRYPRRPHTVCVPAAGGLPGAGGMGQTHARAGPGRGIAPVLGPGRSPSAGG